LKSLGAEKKGTLAHVLNSVSNSLKLVLLLTKEFLSLCFFVLSFVCFSASVHFHTKWHDGLWRSFQFWMYYEVAKCELFMLILIFSLWNLFLGIWRHIRHRCQEHIMWVYGRHFANSCVWGHVGASVQWQWQTYW